MANEIPPPDLALSALRSYDALIPHAAVITEGGWLAMAETLDNAADALAGDVCPFSQPVTKLRDRADDCRARAKRAASRRAA